MVLCGVVWCCVVLCGVDWRGVVWCDVVSWCFVVLRWIVIALVLALCCVGVVSGCTLLPCVALCWIWLCYICCNVLVLR